MQYTYGISMASIYHELMAEFDCLGTQEGQVQFIADRTGFSNSCVQLVLGHLIPDSLVGADWDLEAQARNVGVSIEEYMVAMTPLVRMSLEQKQIRMQEIQTRIARGEDPGLSDDERQRIRRWNASVKKVARLSGEE